MTQYEESALYMYLVTFSRFLAWWTHGQIKYQSLKSVDENRMLPSNSYFKPRA